MSQDFLKASNIPVHELYYELCINYETELKSTSYNLKSLFSPVLPNCFNQNVLEVCTSTIRVRVSGDRKYIQIRACRNYLHPPKVIGLPKLFTPSSQGYLQFSGA